MPEHGPGGEPAAAGIVPTEQASEDLAGDVQPGDGTAVVAQHPPVDVPASPAEGEGDATGDREGMERAGFQGEAQLLWGGIPGRRAGPGSGPDDQTESSRILGYCGRHMAACT